MERVAAAMASISSSSSTSLLLTPLTRGKQANVLSLGSCRAFSSVVELRQPSRLRVAREKSVLRVVSKQAAVSTPTKESAVEKEAYDCVVVGAGISGLCTAQAFATRHGSVVSNVLVTEARDRVGGNITTVKGDGFLWEEGPNSFQPNDSMLAAAIDSGLKDELVLGDPLSPRYVLWGGRLRPVPAGLADLPFFDLLSIFGKLRAGFGAMGLRPGAPGREESVKEFVTRNLGQEVFERLIEPFCSGVYAGDPSKLSMKAAFGKVWKLEEVGGSIIGGTFKMLQERKKNPPPPRDERLPKPKGQTVGSFKKGLISLPNAIAAQLGDKVKLNWKLTAIKKTDAGFTLTYETPDGTETVRARSLVLTVPAYIAKEIVRPLSDGAAEALSKFYYPPVCAATISYPLSALREDRLTDGKLFGFGQLHPRSQGVQTLGTIYSSSLFPNRAPEDRVLLLNYIGGAQFTEITDKTDEEIVKTVDKDLRTMLLKPDAPAPQMHGVRTWPKAIPQFTIGHLDHLDNAKEALRSANCEGLFLGGNYVVGVALGRCVEGAYESAQAISQYVSKLPAKTGSA